MTDAPNIMAVPVKGGWQLYNIHDYRHFGPIYKTSSAARVAEQNARHQGITNIVRRRSP